MDLRPFVLLVLILIQPTTNNGGTTCQFQDGLDYCTLACFGGNFTLVAVELELAVYRHGTCRQNDYAIRINSSVRFLNGTIIPGRWLRTAISVSTLEMDLRYINHIQTDAFNTPALNQLHTLIMVNFNVRIFNVNTFRGMPTLGVLTFINLQTSWFPGDFAADVAGSLKVLNVFATSTMRDVTFNVDGLTGGAILHRAEHVLYTLNLRDSITRRTLSALVSAVYLDMSNCGIEFIADGAFEAMQYTLKMLKLDSNRLHSIPAQLFDGLLAGRTNLAISLVNNPWRCDCELDALRGYLSGHRERFAGDPVCELPEHLAGSKAVYAEFNCDGSQLPDAYYSPVMDTIPHCPNWYNEWDRAEFTLLMLPRRQVSVRLSLVNRSLSVWQGLVDRRQGTLVWRNRTTWSRSAVEFTRLVCWMELWRGRISPYDCVTFHGRLPSGNIWMRPVQKQHSVSLVCAGMIGLMFVGLAATLLLRWLIQIGCKQISVTSNYTNYSSWSWEYSMESRYTYASYFQEVSYESTRCYEQYKCLVVLSDYCKLDRIPAHLAPKIPRVNRRKSIS